MSSYIWFRKESCSIIYAFTYMLSFMHVTVGASNMILLILLAMIYSLHSSSGDYISDVLHQHQFLSYSTLYFFLFAFPVMYSYSYIINT